MPNENGKDGTERDRSRARPTEDSSKRHGDALREGSGTRHGVTERDERPRVPDREQDR